MTSSTPGATCPKCGARAAAGAKFCESCGAALAGSGGGPVGRVSKVRLAVAVVRTGGHRAPEVEAARLDVRAARAALEDAL